MAFSFSALIPRASGPSAHPPVVLLDLGPVQQLRWGRLGRRLSQLMVGLLLCGFSLALLVQGTLGMAPWDVLHSGLTRYVPLSLGQVIVVASFALLLLWFPLREKPGVGTIANALVVGLAADATLAVVPEPEQMGWRVFLVVVGVVLNGLGTAVYVGAQLGRGPRDGLMTGIARHTGASLRLVRTALEVVVVAVGVLLGGVLGVATVLFALAIGPLTQLFLPWVLVERPSEVLPDDVMTPQGVSPQGVLGQRESGQRESGPGSAGLSDGWR